MKGCVEKWCEPRRTQLAKDGLGVSRSKLDALIDQWNGLYVTKFCSENKNLLEAAGWRKQSSTNSQTGATHNNPQASHESAPQNEPVAKELDFEGVIWPTVKNELMEFAEARILRWVEDRLRERMQALESLTQPPLLKANSSPESYKKYVGYLVHRTEAAGKNSAEMRNSEAVISLAIDLLPGLEERLRDQLEHVVDKQEDRLGTDGQHDQTTDTDHDGGNDESSSAHESLEGADHNPDHKVQEAQDENHDEDEHHWELSEVSEEDESEDEYSECSEDFEEDYADESEDDTYKDPDSPDREYRGSVIESIEPRTPIVTPRVMKQLRRYQLRTAKIEEETASAVIRSVDEQEREVASRKRKAPHSAKHSLAIRNKSMEQRLAAVGTPTPVDRKRQRLHQSQSSRASTACSSELLPSLEDIFNSSIGRASSATTQPPPNSSSPASRRSKKKKNREDRSRSKSKVSSELGDTTTGIVTAPPPGGMIGASPELGTRGASRDFVFEKSVSRHPVPEERFREETAEFQAMTPSAREAMLYTALREMRRRQG